MAAPNYARFRINATPSTQGYYEATNAQALTFDLEDASRVLAVTYSAYHASDSTSPLATLGAPQFNFSNASHQITKNPASDDEVTNAPSPVGGAAWIIRATASLPGGTHVFERKLLVRNGQYGLVIPGETTQGGPRGWGDEVMQGSGFPVNVAVAGAFALAGVLTPATITGQQNDYAPAGGADAAVWRLSSNAEQFITGIAFPASGRVIRLMNVGVNPIGLASDHPSSAAANRFSDLPGAADSFGEGLFILPNEAIDVWYDPSSLRWRFVTRAKNVLGETTFSTGPMAADTHNLNRFLANFVRLSANAGPFNLTGLSAGTDRMLVVLWNAGANAFNLAHESGSSTAANRFSLPGGTPYSLAAGAAITLIYDGTSSRWRLANPTAGVASVPADLVASETFAMQGVLTPAQITAQQDNYNPSGLADAITLRLSTDANSRIITGIAGGATGRVLLLQNLGSFTLDLDNENASSTAANRILTPGTGRHAINPAETAILQYDGTSSRWRVIGVRTDVLGRFSLTSSGTGNFGDVNRFTASYLRFNGTGAAVQLIDGLTAGVDRTRVVVSNVGTQNLSIQHESGTATAANRFTLPGGFHVILVPGESLTFIYDATSSRWRLSSATSHVLALNGFITPAQITADQNDYAPTGIGNATRLRVSTNANGRRITGIVGGFEGRTLIIDNVGSFELALLPDSGSSAAANRMILQLGGNGELRVFPNESVVLVYDGTTSRWRQVGTFSSILGKWTLGTTALTADLHNAGRFGSNYIRIDPDALGPWRLTGVDAGKEREELVITNADAGSTAGFIIANENASSTAANRFNLPYAEIIVMPGDAVRFIYDTSIARWKLASNVSRMFSGAQVFDSVTANQNNYAPANHAIAGLIGVSTDAAREITGLAGGVHNRALYFQNFGAFTVVLKDENASSTAANRFGFSGADVILGPGQAILLLYDGAAQRWFPNSFAPTSLTLTKNLDLAGIVSPAQITANQNNYNPSGLASTSILRLNTDGTLRTISGLVAPLHPRVLHVFNVGTMPFVLSHEDTNSTAANRFSFGGFNMVVTPGQCVMLWYDATSSRWRSAANVEPTPSWGANLTDANQTLAIAGGANYVMPGGTTTAARDKTLGATGAAGGLTISVFVQVQGHNVVFKDDAGSPATLHTVTAGAKQIIDFIFDGGTGRFKLAGWKPLG